MQACLEILLGQGYSHIVRNNQGFLQVFLGEPTKSVKEGIWYGETIGFYISDNPVFSFIEWKDEYSTNIDLVLNYIRESSSEKY